MASSNCGTPIFAVADVQTSGNTFAAIVAFRSPDTSSSSVSVPASKNFSISGSSASATISISASRAVSTASMRSAGTASSLNLPLSSVWKIEGLAGDRDRRRRETIVSSPIGS